VSTSTAKRWALGLTYIALRRNFKGGMCAEAEDQLRVLVPSVEMRLSCVYTSVRKSELRSRESEVLSVDLSMAGRCAFRLRGPVW